MLAHLETQAVRTVPFDLEGLVEIGQRALGIGDVHHRAAHADHPAAARLALAAALRFLVSPRTRHPDGLAGPVSVRRPDPVPGGVTQTGPSCGKT